MRIGILTPSYPPDLNGVSISIYNLQKELESKGVEVYIATSRKKGVKYSKNIQPLRSLPLPKFINSEARIPLMSQKLAKKFFQENNVEIVHTHDIFAGGMEGVAIAKSLGIPAVNTFHTYMEFYIDNYARFYTKGYLTLPGYRSLLRKFIKKVADDYDHIFSVSDKTDIYLKETIKTTTKTSVISNLPETKDLGVFPKNKDLMKEHGIKEDDFVFITFGRVGPEKGLDLGIKVIEPLMRKYDNIKYLIIGWGPYIGALERLVNKLGLDGKVIIPGIYKHEDLGQINSLGDVYLNTSSTETQGLVLFEAMYCGLPAVCINDPAFDYLLKDNYNGCKGDINTLTEECEKLFLDRDLKEKMSQSAKKSADKLKNRNFSDHYLEVYKKLINSYSSKKQK